MNTMTRRIRTRLAAGFASVEFALLLVFIIAPIMVAVIDFGQIMHTKYILTRASEAGVMAAANGQDPNPVVRQYLTSAGKDVSRMSVSVTPNYATMGIGTTVQVTTNYNLSGLPIIPWSNMIPSLSSLSSSATARHQ